MPETPDFEELARIIICGIDAPVIQKVIKDDRISAAVVSAVAQVEAQLRFLWNARGAADREALRVEFKRAMETPRPVGSVEIRPEEVLRALDVKAP